MCGQEEEEEGQHDAMSEGAVSLPLGGIDRAALGQPGSTGGQQLPMEGPPAAGAGAAGAGQPRSQAEAGHGDVVATTVVGLLQNREAMAVLVGGRA
jgi:hypothetical protein